jgi:hypothetical protein
MRRLLIAGLIALGSAANAAAQSSTVTDDAFMQLDASERMRQFEQITPVNRADLLREQLERWRRLHADSLTAEQHQILTEVAAFIRPEHFERSRRTPAEIDAFMALQKKASSAFTQEDSQEAFTLQGRYLRQQ